MIILIQVLVAAMCGFLGTVVVSLYFVSQLRHKRQTIEWCDTQTAFLRRVAEDGVELATIPRSFPNTIPKVGTRMYHQASLDSFLEIVEASGKIKTKLSKDLLHWWSELSAWELEHPLPQEPKFRDCLRRNRSRPEQFSLRSLRSGDGLDSPTVET